MTLDAEPLKSIDDILEPVAERDPGLTVGHEGNG